MRNRNMTSYIVTLCSQNLDFPRKLILGSQSPGRKRVLEKMGYVFEVIRADIDEKAIRFDDPVRLTLALVNAKADALVAKIKEPAILIALDQVVICNNKILEKPADEKEAREYFAMYAIYPAETVTSVVVVNIANGKRVEGTDIAKIWIDKVPEDVVCRYIAEGNSFLCSGGFDHEHPLLLPYIKKIEGEPESVTGLPVALTESLIKLVLE